MEELRGIVRKIRFASSDGRFSVFTLEARDTGKLEVVALRGGVPYVGESVLLRGGHTRHPRFGMQFSASSMEMVKPEESGDIKQFLSSGLIAGIGPSMAEKIVSHFGKKTLSIFENNMDALLEVPGIGKKTLERIKDSYAEISSLQNLILLLESMGLPERYAAEMQKLYGDEVETVMQEDPYRMIGEVPGLTFNEADRMAMHQGVDAEDGERILHGIRHMLGQALAQGHACAPAARLYQNTARLLHISETAVEAAGQEGVESGEIPSLNYQGTLYLYLPPLYEAETESAVRVQALMKGKKLGSAKLAMEAFERDNHIQLAPEQKDAVEMAMEYPLLVITGGPGTGKTTLVRAILMAAGQHGLSVHLMAPTGRAAKRLALASGEDADTIHKALEAQMRDGGGTDFNKNESDPLEEDLILVDEASMMDITLFYHLLAALKDGARLILVGDVDQLPPVGPGMPLKSIIAWGAVPVVRLTRIFRQKEGSGIIENAALIREGEPCVPDEKGEFQILPTWSEEDAFEQVMGLCQAMDYENHKMTMQVLSPMYRGPCGVDNLNHAIQERVQGRPVPTGLHFHVGDKVMQKKNDYDKGVYNGDTGVVWAVTDKTVSVHFDDKEITYEGDERGDLQLAYAVTVHKSQGSEYDSVIFVLLPTQWMMLKRNLLYTGVTRARKTTYLITTEEALQKAVDTVETGGRYSLFLPLLEGEAEA